MHLNVGSNDELTKQLAEIIAKSIGFEGNFEFDKLARWDASLKLDTKLMDKMGWRARTRLEELTRPIETFRARSLNPTHLTDLENYLGSLLPSC